MEYCGGGSVADIVKIMDHGLNEDQIALICREALKVSSFITMHFIRECECVCVCFEPLHKFHLLFFIGGFNIRV
jgi:hypothetical protein